MPLTEPLIEVDYYDVTDIDIKEMIDRERFAWSKT